MSRAWLRLADPDAASDQVRRDSRGLTAEDVRAAKRIVRDGGVADTPEVARLVMTLATQHRRGDGSLVLTGVLAAGAAVWAIVRLLMLPWNAETWVVVVAAVLQVPAAVSMLRSRQRLPAVERDNAALAADAGMAEELPPPPMTMISLIGLLRRHVLGLLVGGVLFGIFITLVNGKPLTPGRVLGAALGWTVLMALLILGRAWGRAHSSSEATPGNDTH